MKKLVLVLCLMLLVSCGSDDTKTDLSGGTDAPKQQTVQGEVTTAPEKEETKAEDTKKEDTKAPASENNAPERTPEEQLVDKNLITLLREQLAGAYDVKDVTFTYICTEQLEDKECFAYRMEKEGVCETFAVATDSSAIFHLQGKDFVKIFG